MRIALSIKWVDLCQQEFDGNPSDCNAAKALSYSGQKMEEMDGSAKALQRGLKLSEDAVHSLNSENEVAE